MTEEALHNLYTNYLTDSNLDIAQVTGVRTQKSEDVGTSTAVDPVTNQPLDPQATVSTLNVDVVTFVGSRSFKNVPVLTPIICPRGTGMFVSPQIGDLCVVGFLNKNQPMVLGFYIPPDETGAHVGSLPIGLKPGEIALLAPASEVPSGMFLLQGGVLQLKAGQNATWSAIPAGDVLAGQCRNYRLITAGSTYEIFETDDPVRNTFLRDRIANQALFLDVDAPFVERLAGFIDKFELNPSFQGSISEPADLTRFTGPVLQQVNINNETFIANDESGSIIAEVTNPNALVDLTTEGSIQITSKQTLDIELDTGLEESIPISISAEAGNGQVEIRVGASSIIIRDEQVTITAGTITLANGDQSAVLGDTLTTFLSALVAHSATHVHTADGDPTTPPTVPPPTLPVITSTRVRLS